MPVDDRVGDGSELAIVTSSVGAQHLEGTLLIDRMTFHQNPFRTFDQRAPAERTLKVLELGKAA